MTQEQEARGQDDIQAARSATEKDPSAEEQKGSFIEFIDEAADQLERSWERLRIPSMSADEMARIGPDMSDHAANVELAVQIMRSLTGVADGSSDGRELSDEQRRRKWRLVVPDGTETDEVDGTQASGEPIGKPNFWQDNVQYGYNSLVAKGGENGTDTYRCIKEPPIGKAPDSEGGEEFWKKVYPPEEQSDKAEVNATTADGRSTSKVPDSVRSADGNASKADRPETWRQDKQYVNGHMVMYADERFKCIKRPDVGVGPNAPNGPEFWSLIKDTDGEKSSPETENDATCTFLPKDEVYSPEKQYEEDDEVIFDTHRYRCIKRPQGPGSNPKGTNGSEFWKQIGPVE